MIKIIQDLIKVATNEIDHDYYGLCPDIVDGFDCRDPDCKACQIIMSAERYLTSHWQKGEDKMFWRILNKSCLISFAIGFGYSSALQMSTESYITLGLMMLCLLIDIIANKSLHLTAKQRGK